MGQTIAITGATGFVGGRLVERLSAQGHHVLAFGRRPADQFIHRGKAAYTVWDITSGPLAGAPPVDTVVHSAAAVADWGDRSWFEAVHVSGTRHALDSFPSAERFIHISTASVYGSQGHRRNVREDVPLPRVYRSEYARTKALAEKVVREHGRPAVVLRPHAIYGPGDPTLVPRLLRANRFGVQFTIGNGRNRISLTHIDNFAHAVECCLERADRFQVYNVADALADPLDDVLRALLQALGKPARLVHLPRRLAYHLATLSQWRTNAPLISGGTPLLTPYAIEQLTTTLTLDITKARMQLGYEPRHSYKSTLPAFAAAGPSAIASGRW